tara:strand:- start:420 stop:731 length:312 start_codon:yes stop_codon:yes gene_type:complete
LIANKRISADELINCIPEWCTIGNLVWVDGCFLGIDKDQLGIIISSWVIDVENIDEEEYNHIMRDGEWLLLDVVVDGQVLEQIETYCLTEFKHKMEEECQSIT